MVKNLHFVEKIQKNNVFGFTSVPINSKRGMDGEMPRFFHNPFGFQKIMCIFAVSINEIQIHINYIKSSTTMTNINLNTMQATAVKISPSTFREGM